MKHLPRHSCCAFLLLAASMNMARAEGRLFFPQFVNGETGGVLNRTRIILRNNCDQQDLGVIQFRAPDGASIEVPVGGSVASERAYEIDPWGVLDLETDGTGPLLNGSIEIVSDQGRRSCLSGSIAYDVLGSRVSSESSQLDRLHQVYATRNGTERAGMAIYNPDPQNSVRMEALLVDETGNIRADRDLELGPRSQTSVFIDDATLFSSFFQANPGDFNGTVNVNTLFAGSRFPGVAVIGLIQDAATNGLTAVGTRPDAFTQFRVASLATPRTNLRLSASEIVLDIPIRVDFQDDTGTAPSQQLTVVYELGDSFFGTVPAQGGSNGESGFRVIRPPSSASPETSGSLQFVLHRVVAPELLQTGVIRPVAIPIKLSMSNSAGHPSNEVETYVLVDAGGVIQGLDGARYAALSPDGDHLYVASVNDDAVAVFERDSDNGTLRLVETIFDADELVDGLNGASHVAVSPDGLRVYAAAAGGNSLAVFERNLESGELTFLGSLRDGEDGANSLRMPSSIAVSPDGDLLYVTSARDDALNVFEPDSRTGRLRLLTEFLDNTSGVDGLDGARFAAVSPNGRNVYVASGEDALAVFGPDDQEQISFLEVFFDGMDNVVDGLGGAAAVAVSPDGERVYVASSSDDALAVFERDLETGRLTFVTALFDGVGGIDGLNGARAVTVSPDNRNIYVASEGDNAVVAFERTPGGGALRFVGALRDNVGGVDGLADASSVTISPDGRHVYVTGPDDDGVAVFRRDPQTGFLLFVEVRLEIQGGVEAISK